MASGEAQELAFTGSGEHEHQSFDHHSNGDEHAQDHGASEAPSDAHALKGTVKWFDANMGYGYISPAGGGKEVFVHKKQIRSGSRALQTGVPVDYYLAKEGDKDVAHNVLATGNAPDGVEDKSRRGPEGKSGGRLRGVDPVFDIPARFRGPQDENERIPYDGRNKRPEGAKFEKGFVKWFDAQKGFGFIAPDDGGKDVFVHQSVIHADGFRRLQDGQEVEYIMTVEGDKHVANNVTGKNGAIIDTTNMRDPKPPRRGSRREDRSSRDRDRPPPRPRRPRRDDGDFESGPPPRGTIMGPGGPRLDRSAAGAGSSITEKKGYTKTDGSVHRGQVTWFDNKKGYGFITPEAGGENVFVHQSEIYSRGYRTLTAGEPTEYSVCYNDKGECTAINVTGPGGFFVVGERRSGGGPRGDRDRDRRGRSPPMRKRRRDDYDDYDWGPPPPRGSRGGFRTTVVQPPSYGSTPPPSSYAPPAAPSPAPAYAQPAARATPTQQPRPYSAPAPAPQSYVQPQAQQQYNPYAAPATAASYPAQSSYSAPSAYSAPTPAPYAAGSYASAGYPGYGAAAAARPATPAYPQAAATPYGGAYNPYAR